MKKLILPLLLLTFCSTVQAGVFDTVKSFFSSDETEQIALQETSASTSDSNEGIFDKIKSFFFGDDSESETAEQTAQQETSASTSDNNESIFDKIKSFFFGDDSETKTAEQTEQKMTEPASTVPQSSVPQTVQQPEPQYQPNIAPAQQAPQQPTPQSFVQNNRISPNFNGCWLHSESEEGELIIASDRNELFFVGGDSYVKYFIESFDTDANSTNVIAYAIGNFGDENGVTSVSKATMIVSAMTPNKIQIDNEAYHRTECGPVTLDLFNTLPTNVDQNTELYCQTTKGKHIQLQADNKGVVYKLGANLQKPEITLSRPYSEVEIAKNSGFGTTQWIDILFRNGAYIYTVTSGGDASDINNFGRVTAEKNGKTLATLECTKKSLYQKQDSLLYSKAVHYLF